MVPIFNGHDSGTDLLQVPTIYKAYVREYPQQFIWPYMVLTCLHFRILKFPLIYVNFIWNDYDPPSLGFIRDRNLCRIPSLDGLMKQQILRAPRHVTIPSTSWIHMEVS